MVFGATGYGHNDIRERYRRAYMADIVQGKYSFRGKRRGDTVREF